MKKFITLLASLLILAGLWPAASSLLAQGDYGTWQAQGDPQPQYQQPPYSNSYPPPSAQSAPGYPQSGYPQQGYPQQGGDPNYSQQGAPPPPPGYQDPNQVAQNGQPPNQTNQTNPDQQPGVARASYIHGDVSSQRGDNGELVPLTLNTPLEAGDRVSTSDNGRAEIQLDYADVLRLSGGATAKIAALNRQGLQVQVGRGLTTFSELNGAEANAEIDTPNTALHPTAAGEFRIQVTADDNTQIIVRHGAADISTPQGSTHVDAGQMITVQGTDNPQYKIDPAPARDEWDTFNDQRDSRIQNADNYKNTDRYYTGSQDMGGYGEWSEVPDYGQVWTPDEGSDWAPYRDGRWVYEPYYGWTWVAAEPWGWAPYHYGRWFMNGSRWSWWPGPVYGYPGYYPVYAPAYVSFFGWGGAGFGFGVGFGFGAWGHVGWLPIGPGDWYHPWYGGWAARGGVVGFRDGGFNDRVGFGPLHGPQGRQFSNVHDALSNDRVRSGMSSMNGSDFGRGAVPRNQERISDASFRQSSMMAGRMPASPSRESFSPTGREANASAFHNMPSNSQHFYSPSHTAPGAANGRAFGAVNNGAASRNTFTSPSGAANRGAQGGSTNNGFQRFTPPSHASQPQNYDRGTESRSGTSGAYSRPTLNMRQPVVTPRGGNNPSEQQRGYSAPQQRSGTYSAPAQRSGGGYSAPRSGGSAPRPPSGGGNRGGGGSRGGGGRSSGGGGGHHGR